MNNLPTEILELMRLAETARRPLRRYLASVREASQAWSNSDEYDAAVARGSEALRDLGTVVRLWVKDHPERKPEDGS